MKNSIFLFFTILLLALPGCREDSIIDVDMTETTIDQSTSHTVNLKGRVVDEVGEGIANATVIIANSEYLTDSYGFYSVSGVKAPSTGLYVKVLKTGYFVGGTQVFPRKENTVLDLEAYVTLAIQQAPELFKSATGIDVMLADDVKIVIPSNAITKDGDPYDGTVEMHVKWLNPAAATTRDLMPGALLGLNEQGDRQMLRTFGMIGVELSDPSGAELNIAAGQIAKLEFPLPTEVASDAPQSIPLWHFNETTGVWEEEGSAVRSGDVYSAEVSHFSWWNCDIPFDLTELCITFVDSRGGLVMNTSFCLECDNLGLACADINNDNTICNLAPMNELLTLTMQDNCGAVYYTQDIGPFTTDQSAITVVVNYPPNYETINISGLVSDCDGSLVEEGFVIAETNSGTFYDYYLTNGEYSIDYLLCSENDLEVTLTGTDLIELQQGESQITIDPNQNDYTQNLNACGSSLDSYIIIRNTDTGAIQVLDSCTVKSTAVETLILGVEGSTTPLLMGIKGFAPGDFVGNVFYTGSNSDFSLFDNSDIDLTEFEVIRYDNVGGYVTGTFSFNGIITGEFVGERVQ